VRLEALWAAMAAEDASSAYDAMWALVALPDRAVAYLRNRFPRPPAADDQRIRTLLSQLDDERFTTRERAAKELAKFGESAEPQLRAQLAETKSPEVAQRLEVLLQSVTESIGDAESLRALRSLEVLERIATPEARAALEELAGGVCGPKLKARAEKSLRRLDRLRAP
jgi:HEAT repeat protein